MKTKANNSAWPDDDVEVWKETTLKLIRKILEGSNFPENPFRRDIEGMLRTSKLN